MVKHLAARGVAARTPVVEQRLERVGSFPAQGPAIRLEALDQDVEIPHRAQALRQHPELVSEVPNGLLPEVTLDDAEGRALSAGGHAHAMESLGILALARALLLGQHALEVELEDRAPRLGHRLVGARGGRLLLPRRRFAPRATAQQGERTLELRGRLRPELVGTE